MSHLFQRLSNIFAWVLDSKFCYPGTNSRCCEEKISRREASMQVEDVVSHRVDIDGVEELDGLPHEVGLADQQVELGQGDDEVGDSFSTHSKVSILIVVFVPIIIEDHGHQLPAVGKKCNAMICDRHIGILFCVKNSQSRARCCQHCQQLVCAAVGDLELGEQVEAADKVKQLALDARLALDVKEEVEDGQGSQFVPLVKHQKKALACHLIKQCQ